MLLERQADPNIVDHNGWSPLHIAAYKNSPETVQLLLSYNADRSIMDKSGKTASEKCTDPEL